MTTTANPKRAAMDSVRLRFVPSARTLARNTEETHKRRTIMKTTTILLWLSATIAHAWVTTTTRSFRSRSTSSLDAAVGIFFGTSTGNTENCAEKLYEAFGADCAAAPVDVDTLEGSAVAAALAEHDAVIVGAPTWNTGADTERSGTGWDALYYSGDLEAAGVLQGKKVAVFGLGDQVSYAENYADATGELYDVFTALGCDMVPYAMTSQEGYEHEDSKSIRGDKFCGLLLDEVNQEDFTDERVEAWVEQLKAGGFLDGSSTSSSTEQVASPAAADSAPVIEAEIQDTLAEASVVLEETIAKHSTATDFVPHFNPLTKKTMWTSPDGRESFVTTASPPTTQLRP